MECRSQFVVHRPRARGRSTECRLPVLEVQVGSRRGALPRSAALHPGRNASWNSSRSREHARARRLPLTGARARILRCRLEQIDDVGAFALDEHGDRDCRDAVAGRRNFPNMNPTWPISASSPRGWRRAARQLPQRLRRAVPRHCAELPPHSRAPARPRRLLPPDISTRSPPRRSPRSRRA